MLFSFSRHAEPCAAASNGTEEAASASEPTFPECPTPNVDPRKVDAAGQRLAPHSLGLARPELTPLGR